MDLIERYLQAVLGTVTLVFAILERVDSKTKFLVKWDPRDLPAARDPNRIPRNSTIEVAVNVVFAVWWVTNMWSTTVFNRGGVRITLAPVWKDLLWVFLLLAIANIILALANLARPCWTWPRASVQLALTVGGCVAFCALVKANVLAEIVIPNVSPDRGAQIVNAINADASKSFPFVVFACVLIVALSGVGRLIRLKARRKRLIQGLAI